MAVNGPRPLVGIPTNLLEVSDRRYPAHAAGEKNVDAVDRCADCIPIMVPGIGERLDIECFVDRIDGVLLTGGRANVEPHHYGGPPFPPDEPIDPGRDATVLALVRACIEKEVPVFGVCRGIQEMNVALGGTLHYRVHLLEDKEDHRMPRRDDVTVEEIFKLRHPVRLSEDGTFRSLVNGADEVLVNSLHGQGIDRLADDLEVEAVTPDDLVEGVRLKNDATFTVGVQWHAEWKPEEHELSMALFREFGEAARERMRKRSS